MVLITAYKGDLTAIITKPTMNTPFTNAEAMVEQTQIKWGVSECGIFNSNAQKKAPGTTLRKIIDQGIAFSKCAGTWVDDYYTSTAKKYGNIAAICDSCYACNN